MRQRFIEKSMKSKMDQFDRSMMNNEELRQEQRGIEKKIRDKMKNADDMEIAEVAEAAMDSNPNDSVHDNTIQGLVPMNPTQFNNMEPKGDIELANQEVKKSKKHKKHKHKSGPKKSLDVLNEDVPNSNPEV